MSTRQEVRYEGTPCKVMAVLENAIILRRASGAEFTAVLNDPKITIHDLPGEAGVSPQQPDPTPGDAQDVLDGLKDAYGPNDVDDEDVW